MLSQRGKQQRSVIFHPEVTLLLDKALNTCVAFIENICRLEMVRMEPSLVTASLRRMDNCSFIFYTKKEVNRRLFVSI